MIDGVYPVSCSAEMAAPRSFMRSKLAYPPAHAGRLKIIFGAAASSPGAR